MTRRPAVVATVVALTVLGLAPAAGAAEAPQPRVSALTAVHIGAGVDVGHWAHHTPPSTPIAATHLADDVDALRLTAAGTGRTVSSFEVRAPAGTPRLAVGTHAVGSTDATVRLSFTSRGDCSASEGSLDVLAVEHDDAGRITSLAANFDVRCTGGLTHAGSVRWNTDVPYVFTTMPERVDATPLPFGQTVRASVDVTNSGTAATTYGPSSFPWVLDSDAPHTIEKDGCAGVTVAPGGTCRVDLAFTPVADRGVFLSHLATPDGSPGRGLATTWVSVDLWEPARPAITTASVRGGVRLTTTSDAPAFEVVRNDTTIATDVALPWTDTTAVVGENYWYYVRAKQHGATSAISNLSFSGALPVPRGPEGEFVTLAPKRVLDTRKGTGARVGTLGHAASLTFDPLAGTGVPRTGVIAVLLNVTGAGATARTHIRAWPSGTPRPETSSLNLMPGRNRPNQVVVPLGADGKVALYNHSGTTHVIADVQGYYTSATGAEGGGFHTLPPTPALDTRVARPSAPAAPLNPDEVLWIPVTLPAGTGKVSALDVNLTVTAPRTNGHLTAWSGTGTAPGVSNANFVGGQTIANHSVVPVSYRSGRPGFAVHNASQGTTHLVVDVQGWYDDGTPTDGLRYTPVPTQRLVDTRRSVMTRVSPGSTVTLTPVRRGLAHVVNVTATDGKGPGHLTAWSGTGTRPSTSAVNYVAGEDASNLAVVTSPGMRQIAVTPVTFPTHVVVDQLGYFY